MDDTQNPTQNPGMPADPTGTPDTGAPMGGEQMPQAPEPTPTAPVGGEPTTETPTETGVPASDAPTGGDVNQGGTV